MIFQCSIGKAIPEGKTFLKYTFVSQSDTCPIGASNNGAKGQRSKLQKDRAEYPSFLFWDKEIGTYQNWNEKSEKTLLEE